MNSSCPDVPVLWGYRAFTRQLPKIASTIIISFHIHVSRHAITTNSMSNLDVYTTCWEYSGFIVARVWLCTESIYTLVVEFLELVCPEILLIHCLTVRLQYVLCADGLMHYVTHRQSYSTHMYVAFLTLFQQVHHSDSVADCPLKLCS